MLRGWVAYFAVGNSSECFGYRACNAWRNPPGRDQNPNGDEPDNDPDHPDQNADAVRRAALKAREDQLQNAWRNPPGLGNPSAATAIERQGERWRGGR
jgi:hypothetical protein